MSTVSITKNNMTIHKKFDNVALAESTYRWYEQNMVIMGITQIEIQTPTYFYRNTIEKI